MATKVPMIVRLVAGASVAVPTTLLVAGFLVANGVALELVATVAGVAGGCMGLFFQRFLTPETDA